MDCKAQPANAKPDYHINAGVNLRAYGDGRLADEFAKSHDLALWSVILKEITQQVSSVINDPDVLGANVYFLNFAIHMSTDSARTGVGAAAKTNQGYLSKAYPRDTLRVLPLSLRQKIYNNRNQVIGIMNTLVNRIRNNWLNISQTANQLKITALTNRPDPLIIPANIQAIFNQELADYALKNYLTFAGLRDMYEGLFAPCNNLRHEVSDDGVAFIAEGAGDIATKKYFKKANQTSPLAANCPAFPKVLGKEYPPAVEIVNQRYVSAAVLVEFRTGYMLSIVREDPGIPANDTPELIKAAINLLQRNER